MIYYTTRQAVEITGLCEGTIRKYARALKYDHGVEGKNLRLTKGQVQKIVHRWEGIMFMRGRRHFLNADERRKKKITLKF